MLFRSSSLRKKGQRLRKVYHLAGVYVFSLKIVAIHRIPLCEGKPQSVSVLLSEVILLTKKEITVFKLSAFDVFIQLFHSLILSLPTDSFQPYLKQDNRILRI